MITRRDVIADAADKCMKELYSLAQPAITWEDFIKENKEFIKREEEYYKLPKENRISYKEFMGPKPYEFYYLPKEVLKEIVDNYIYAYEIDEHQNLLDTIDLLKKYCDDPIEEFYHPKEGEKPGYRDYRRPDNLVTCLISELKEYANSDISEEIVYKAKDLFELCIDSGAIMLMQAKITKTKEEGVKILQENVKNGISSMIDVKVNSIISFDKIKGIRDAYYKTYTLNEKR